MELVDNKQTRPALAVAYAVIVMLAGATGIVFECFHLMNFSNVWICVGILCFLAISEGLPLRIAKRSYSLGYPFVYLLFILNGFSAMVVSYGIIQLLIGLIQRRPIRTWFLQPAVSAVSLFAAFGFEAVLFPHSITGMTRESMNVIVFTGVYFFVSILLRRGLSFLRFERDTLEDWVLGLGIEMGIAIYSMLYLRCFFQLNVTPDPSNGMLMLFLLLPALAVAVLAYLGSLLLKQHQRSNNLFTLTKELNRLLFSSEWQKKIESLFVKFIDVDASAFWVKVGTDWLLYHRNGEANSDYELPAEYKEAFATLKEIKLVRNRKKERIPAESYFSPILKSFIFAPLTVENGSVGMLVVARRRTNGFSSQEMRSVATFANQAAVLLKAHALFSEQEKRLILEERNRIAREIHDGIAQSIAGAVMKLETAGRVLSHDMRKAESLIRTSTAKLRMSLKEIRESIYQLRPNLTEQIGLRRAIREKLKEIENEGGPSLVFQEYGKVSILDEEVKRVIYELIQEALYNCVKHASAEKVWVTLTYKETYVELVIKDNGIGFSLVDAMMKARNEPHFGILNMNEQAENIGGTLQIESQIGIGTTVQFRVKNDLGEEFEDDSIDVG